MENTKFISGYYEKVWENTIPSDGIVDRLQVIDIRKWIQITSRSIPLSKIFYIVVSN